MIRVPADALRRQTAVILTAWGMPENQAEETASIMVAADLRGIDSHGVAMLDLYAEHRAMGKIVWAPEISVVRQNPATALVDGGGGLGHCPGALAMRLAVEKAKAIGIGAVAVRNSNHYGAAGVYALMAADVGLIGVSTTSVWNTAIVPTFGTDPMFGTNPIAFAAPARKNPPFVLDMATSTVAIGKVKLAKLLGRDIPEGWVVDANGRPVTDATAAVAGVRRFTPLGSSRRMGGHKGYGLAAMVEILSTMLPGAWWATTRERDHPDADRFNVGHFMLALDPKAFRDDGGFEADLDAMIDELRAAKRADAGQPVLVAGDPERAAAEERTEHGIPLPKARVRILADIAGKAGAPVLIPSV